MQTHHRRYRRKYRQGFSLAEVMLSLIVFLMMTLMFAAVFPIAVRAAHYSNYYAQASLMAQHKIDQLRSAGYDKLDCSDLVNLGIVDNVSGECGPSYSFTGVDNLDQNGTSSTGFFPAGSTGTVTIVDDSTLSNVASPPQAGNVDVVTVTISWPGTGSMSGSYTTSAMVVSMVHE